MAQLYKACEVPYDQNLSLIEQLLNDKLDVNYRGSDGDTPLIRAAYYNSPETVILLIKYGARTHDRVNELESCYLFATAMYFACFYGPHTFCPLISGEIRQHGLCCCFTLPLTCIANPFIVFTYGLCCLCPFQTCAQLTDCKKTWTYCIVPIILLPETLVEDCSIFGRGLPIAPTKEEKEIETLKKLTKGAHHGFEI